LRNPDDEIDGLLLAQPGRYCVILLRFEALCLDLDLVRSGLKLWKVEPARVIGTRASPLSRLLIRDRHRGIRHCRAAYIAYVADDRAGGFPLGEGSFREEE